MTRRASVLYGDAMSGGALGPPEMLDAAAPSLLVLAAQARHPVTRAIEHRNATRAARIVSIALRREDHERSSRVHVFRRATAVGCGLVGARTASWDESQSSSYHGAAGGS